MTVDALLIGTPASAAEVIVTRISQEMYGAKLRAGTRHNKSYSSRIASTRSTIAPASPR